MKKLLAIALALMLLVVPTLVVAEGELTLGSWRTEDGEAVGALLAKCLPFDTSASNIDKLIEEAFQNAIDECEYQG